MFLAISILRDAGIEWLREKLAMLSSRNESLNVDFRLMTRGG